MASNIQNPQALLIEVFASMSSEKKERFLGYAEGYKDGREAASAPTPDPRQAS